MKAVVIYYSYSGNTKKVAEVLIEALKAKVGEVGQIQLLGLDEPKAFFGQCKRALWHKKAQIQPVSFDLSIYNIICLGTPVWAFGPAPAINAYLDKCFGLKDKKVILFTTYGSGAGNNRCLDYMQGILSKKGAVNFSRFSIQQFKVNSKEFVLSEIKNVAAV
jgi:flavodoxin